jgi:hypothetical protein
MNKPSKLLIGLALAAAGALGAGSAFAWHHGGPRVVFGFNVGPYWGPYWGAPYSPYYYPAPVYYPSPVVVSPPAPSVYVERNEQAQAPQAGYWYYCEASRGYYPYVKECPGGWRAVSPTPSPSQ